MARSDEHRPDKRGARDRTSGRGGRPRRPQRKARDQQTGFGPYGPPQTPERERRPDTDRPRRDRDERPSLRIRGNRQASERTTRRDSHTKRAAPRPTRRRRRPPAGVQDEILRLGGQRGPRLVNQMMAAADAFGHDRDREALNLIRSVRDALPDAPSVRELSGLAHYRLGNYRAAARELEAFVELTNSVEQHPVLMDSYRAQRRWRRVEDLWEELAATSPSSELVSEGRIVAAGALGDRGRLEDAVAMLARKAGDVRKPKQHHLRLWYALADLEERAGNLARARDLFARVQRHDPEFADVTERRRALG